MCGAGDDRGDKGSPLPATVEPDGRESDMSTYIPIARMKTEHWGHWGGRRASRAEASTCYQVHVLTAQQQQQQQQEEEEEEEDNDSRNRSPNDLQNKEGLLCCSTVCFRCWYCCQ